MTDSIRFIYSFTHMDDDDDDDDEIAYFSMCWKTSNLV